MFTALHVRFCLFSFCVLFPGMLFAQTEADSTFQALADGKNWRRVFKDDGSRNWSRKWFLDGLRATVTNTPGGMVFTGGPQENDDACHGVLWTKQSFSGDLKIEYTYTRTDTRTEWVNILYLHATGAFGKPTDIAEWQTDRVIPAMQTYFSRMNALHVSYAAFDRDNEDPNEDYVRARRYPKPLAGNFKRTQVHPTYRRTGLFLPGKTYKITVIKSGNQLFFHVAGGERERLFHWTVPEGEKLNEGRIGLRQMYTRSARYGDFVVWELR